MVDPIFFIVNGVLILIALILAVMLLRAGSRYLINYGDNQVQERLKWVILRSLLAMIFIGVLAVMFNIVPSFLEGSG